MRDARPGSSSTFQHCFCYKAALPAPRLPTCTRHSMNMTQQRRGKSSTSTPADEHRDRTHGQSMAYPFYFCVRAHGQRHHTHIISAVFDRTSRVGPDTRAHCCFHCQFCCYLTIASKIFPPPPSPPPCGWAARFLNSCASLKMTRHFATITPHGSRSAPMCCLLDSR